MYDGGEHQGLHYLVMAHLPGGTLAQRMGRGLAPARALAIIRSLTDALLAKAPHDRPNSARALLGPLTELPTKTDPDAAHQGPDQRTRPSSRCPRLPRSRRR